MKLETPVAVAPGRTRCPYCHDSVGVRESVACQACLARHHDACWREGSTCAACGSDTWLEPPTSPKLTHERAKHLLAQHGYEAAAVQALFEAEETRTSPLALLVKRLLLAIGWLFCTPVLFAYATGIGLALTKSQLSYSAGVSLMAVAGFVGLLLGIWGMVRTLKTA